MKKALIALALFVVFTCSVVPSYCEYKLIDTDRFKGFIDRGNEGIIQMNEEALALLSLMISEYMDDTFIFDNDAKPPVYAGLDRSDHNMLYFFLADKNASKYRIALLYGPNMSLYIEDSKLVSKWDMYKLRAESSDNIVTISYDALLSAYSNTFGSDLSAAASLGLNPRFRPSPDVGSESAKSNETSSVGAKADPVSYELPETSNRSITVKTDNLVVGVKKQLPIKAEVNRLTDDAPKKSSLSWASLDEDIAKVSNTGIVTGVSAGTARIVCSIKDEPDNKAIVSIQVLQQIQSLISDSKKIVLFEGDIHNWHVQVKPDDATQKQLNYSASNDNIAITSDGTIYTLKAGQSKVTAEACDGSGKKVVCDVYIEPINPLQVISLGHGIYRSDLFSIEVKNVSLTKSIVNFDFEVSMYNYEGGMINSGTYSLTKKASIKPGRLKDFTMSVFGAGQAYKTEVTIKKVYFSDNTVLEIPVSYQGVWSVTRK